MWIVGRLVDGGEPVRVAIEGARIAGIEAADYAPPGLWIAPGLIDIQVNGFGGHDVNAPDVTADTIRQLTHVMWQHGVTAFCPTVLTQSEARICRSLSAIAEARASDPLVARSIPCIHVEGPYISPCDGPRGAHPAAYVRPPDIDEYGRWQEAANGKIGIVTLSPEYAESADYIRAITGDGVIAAIGHTAASGEQIAAAVRAGARLSTHLGNGAHDLLPRHPNYLWDQLAEDRLMTSFIFDGLHLPPAVMKTVLRAKGVTRTILVSDTVFMAGLPRGVYDRADGDRVELLPSGRLNLFGTPYLAGATLPLTSCLANAIRFAGATLTDAVSMASANPAMLLGLAEGDGRGHIRIGAAADLSVVQHDPVTGGITPRTTIVGGELVYRAETAR